MKNIALLLALVFCIANLVDAQATESFFVVHCDPNEAYNFPSLEVLVDSANNHNIKLTIEFTAPWIDSILPYPYRLNQIAIWQADGHEVGLHHHELGAFGVWDGFTNYSFAEITAAGRDTNDYQGDMDSLYNLIQKVSNFPLKTAGLEDSLEMPSKAEFQTSGQSVEHGFSNPYSYQIGNKSFCKTTHCFINGMIREKELEQQYDSTYHQTMGANTHVYNFVSDPLAIISLFKFINIKGIIPKTVSEILHSCQTATNLISHNQSINIYPNPSKGSINIELPKSKVYRLSLYNSQGLLMLEKTAKNKQSITTSELPSGLYILSGLNSEHKFSRKLMIE
tara:strand:- start:1078 stop:2088 length:1011 start_codon:yes stop_codon:yes gene_type:complete